MILDDGIERASAGKRGKVKMEEEKSEQASFFLTFSSPHGRVTGTSDAGACAAALGSQPSKAAKANP